MRSDFKSNQAFKIKLYPKMCLLYNPITLTAHPLFALFLEDQTGQDRQEFCVRGGRIKPRGGGDVENI